MCEENNISLDNFNFDGFDSITQGSCIESSKEENNSDQITHKLRTIVSSRTGVSTIPFFPFYLKYCFLTLSLIYAQVSTQEILDSFPSDLKDPVLQALEELESAVEIFSRNGLYFNL